jgi:hypothetical protein
VAGRACDLSAAEAPAPAVWPVLEPGVAELGEQPSPLGGGAGQVRHPQFDVVQGAEGGEGSGAGVAGGVTGLTCTSARSVMGRP